MSGYTEAVEKGLKGLEFVSTGYCPGCNECPENQDTVEASFSWSWCDCCKTSMAGDREPIHGKDSEGNIIHMDACIDCIAYIDSGEEPETWEA
jgi:hypothetical protein